MSHEKSFLCYLSLVTHEKSSSHLSFPEEEREALGDKGLVKLDKDEKKYHDDIYIMT